tara:strand:- start:642 stop:839 length:198 start_codon:yes stop_codon:yes gene_type:complete
MSNYIPKIGDLVKAMDRDVQEYGIITDFVEFDPHGIRWVVVTLFGGTKKRFHPTRVEVVKEETIL